MITLRRARNVFKGDFAEIQVQAGSTFNNYVPKNFSIEHGIIHLNERLVKYDEVADDYVPDGSTIDLIDPPGDGLTAFLVVTAIIGVVGSLVSAFLMKPSIPRLGGGEQDVKPDPTFQGIQTTVGSGRKIPFVLGGPLRVGGHIGESFTHVKFSVQDDTDSTIEVVGDTDTSEITARTLSTRVFWGWGPFESISDYEIDDNPYTNITGLRVQNALGTNTQTALEGFSEAKNNRDQSGQGTVTQAGGAKTASTIAAVNTVEIELLFNLGLFHLGANNHFRSRDITVEFAYRRTDPAGSWVVFKQATISAATRSPHRVYIRFPKLDLDRYDISVERITADNVDPAIEDSFVWNILTEVRFGDRAHPGLAQTGFLQIPQERASVPRKYTALVRGASDVRRYWSTTQYGLGFSSNPAWCFLHWLMNPIYGLGKFNTYEDNVDMESFLELAAHCDEDVPDGKGTGGTEKRYTFAFEFKRQMRALDIIRIFERSCGASIVEEAGMWRAVIHKASPRMMVINEGMYERDSCRVDFDVSTERPTRTLVRFQNKDLNYADDTVPVDDFNVPPNEQLIQTAETRWGVTSRNQARRLGHLDLNQARLATKMIDITAGVGTLRRKAGERVGIATLTGGVGVANGRIRVVDHGQALIRIDADVTLDSAKSYEIVVGHAVQPGQTITVSTISLKNIIDQTTDWIELDLVAPASVWKAEPKVGDAYCLGEVNFAVEDYIIERIGLDAKFRRQITGSLYDPDMFNELVIVDDESSLVTDFNPNLTPGPVQSLSATAREISSSIDVIDVGWLPPLGDFIIAGYDVFYRLNGTTSWMTAASVPVTNYTISGELEAATDYDVIVRAFTPTGRRLALSNAGSYVTVTTVT